MRKYITPLLIGVFLLFLGYLAVVRFALRRTEPVTLPPAQNAIIPDASTPMPPRVYSTSTEPIVMATAEGSVTVQNFYRFVEDSEEGMLVLRNKPEYALYYMSATSQFLAIVKREPVEQNASAAKADLLNEMLGIMPQEACKLKITISFQNNPQPLCPKVL